MWLNYKLGKINLETMLAGQRFSERQAGSCSGWPLPLQGLTYDCISQLNFALLG